MNQTPALVSTLANKTGSTQAIERQLVIANIAGLHARPAAAFVKLASRFSSEIMVIRDGDTVNGKSIIGLISLAAENGQTIIVQASGKDALGALNAIQELVDNRFNES